MVCIIVKTSQLQIVLIATVVHILRIITAMKLGKNDKNVKASTFDKGKQTFLTLVLK